MVKFKKSERLCSRKSIEKLFCSGESLYLYPFRLVWINSEQDKCYPARLAISVPVRRIKKAVMRNRIKRVVREAYRKNKFVLYEHLEQNRQKIDMILIYVSGTVYEYDFLEVKITELIQKFIRTNANGKQNL